MNIKTFSLSAMVLSLALCQAPAVFAHDSCEHKHDWILKISEKLNLSSEQKSKIHAIIEKEHGNIEAKHHEMLMIRQNINQSYDNKDITRMKVDEYARQEEQVVGAIIKIRMQERYDVYEVLDDKQKAKMNKMIMDRSQKHKHGCD